MATIPTAWVLVRDINDNLGWPVAGKRIFGARRRRCCAGEYSAPLFKAASRGIGGCEPHPGKKPRPWPSCFAELGPVSGQPFEALPGRQFDLIINGTSASLSGDLPPLPSHILSNEGSAYDMMYGAEPTPFMRWAAAEAAWGSIRRAGHAGRAGRGVVLHLARRSP